MQNLIAHTEIVRAITQGRPRDLQILAELLSAGRDNEAAYHAWVEDRDHVHALSGTYLVNHLRDQLDACSLVDVDEHPQPARSPTRRSPSTRGGFHAPFTQRMEFTTIRVRMTRKGLVDSWISLISSLARSPGMPDAFLICRRR